MGPMDNLPDSNSHLINSDSLSKEESKVRDEERYKTELFVSCKQAISPHADYEATRKPFLSLPA